MAKLEYHYDKSGRIGVLVSYGYGSGFATNGDIRMAVDKRVINYWMELQKQPQLKQFLATTWSVDAPEVKQFQARFAKWGYKDWVSPSSFCQCHLEYVPKHSLIKITEHDGYERLDYTCIGTDTHELYVDE